MKNCVSYENGNCTDEFIRWGFPCKCVNNDNKDNKCSDYSPVKLEESHLTPEEQERLRLENTEFDYGHNVSYQDKYEY